MNFKFFLHDAKVDYSKIQQRLEYAVDLINKDGEKAFIKLNKLNTDSKLPGLFVIDPTTGKLLVYPSADIIGKNALNNSDINGKALAQEAIREARLKLYSADTWTEDLDGESYRNYFYRLAITLEGRVYVVAIGHSNENIQRLFVTKIVDDACKVLKDIDRKKAFKIFSRKNGLFCFKNTYLFVYQINSEKNIVCLYNPNYPEIIGKNIIDLKVNSVFVVQEILKILKHSDNGWIRSYTHIPNSDILAPKDIYVKSVDVDGNKLVVGSGIYLNK